MNRGPKWAVGYSSRIVFLLVYMRRFSSDLGQEGHPFASPDLLANRRHGFLFRSVRLRFCVSRKGWRVVLYWRRQAFLHIGLPLACAIGVSFGVYSFFVMYLHLIAYFIIRTSLMRSGGVRSSDWGSPGLFLLMVSDKARYFREMLPRAATRWNQRGTSFILATYESCYPAVVSSFLSLQPPIEAIVARFYFALLVGGVETFSTA